MNDIIYVVMGRNIKLKTQYILGSYSSTTKAVMAIIKHCIEFEKCPMPIRINDNYFRIMNNGELYSDFEITETSLDK